MSGELEYLDLEDLLALVRALGTGPVRDIGLLDAACARPRSTAFGVDAYPSLQEKAAALLHSLVRNHGLVDGNKRLGWLATAVLLELNGRPVSAGVDDEVFELVMRVAEGSVDVEEIANTLTQWTDPPTSKDARSRACLAVVCLAGSAHNSQPRVSISTACPR